MSLAFKPLVVGSTTRGFCQEFLTQAIAEMALEALS